jgi:type I restriction enzyme M protein
LAKHNLFFIFATYVLKIIILNMITGELRSQVDKVWEAFWTGGISNPLTVIEQFTYLLFIRGLDAKQNLEEQKAMITGKPIQNPIYKEEHQKFRWSQFINQDPEVMFDLFTKPQADSLTVFEHMKQLGAAGGAFAENMKGATFMIPTPRLLDMV